MDKISVEEFYKRTLSFREKMGRAALTEEQRQNLKKMFVLSYFNVDENDADFDREKIVNTFSAQIDEYTARMLLMGMEP